MTLKRKFVIMAVLVVAFLQIRGGAANTVGFCTYAGSYGYCWSDGLNSQVTASSCDGSWCDDLYYICLDWCLNTYNYQNDQYCWDNWPEYTDCDFGCVCYW